MLDYNKKMGSKIVYIRKLADIIGCLHYFNYICAQQANCLLFNYLKVFFCVFLNWKDFYSISGAIPGNLVSLFCYAHIINNLKEHNYD